MPFFILNVSSVLVTSHTSHRWFVRYIVGYNLSFLNCTVTKTTAKVFEMSL